MSQVKNRYWKFKAAYAVRNLAWSLLFTSNRSDMSRERWEHLKAYLMEK